MIIGVVASSIRPIVDVTFSAFAGQVTGSDPYNVDIIVQASEAIDTSVMVIVTVNYGGTSKNVNVLMSSGTNYAMTNTSISHSVTASASVSSLSPTSYGTQNYIY